MNTKTPLYSIITVCFNSQETIGNTLLSINKQTYKNIQHVIIDGGSTDNTLSIIIEKSRRKNIIISEKDNGIYDAMNKGLGIASGEYISFLNSDDIFANNQIVEKVVTSILKSSSDVAYGNISFFKDEPNNVKRKWICGKFSSNKLIYGWHPPHPSLVISRQAFKKTGFFDTKFKITSDYDFMLRLFKLNDLKTIYIDETIVNMRLGGASTSIKGILTSLSEYVMILKKNNFSNYRIILTLISRYSKKLKQINI